MQYKLLGKTGVFVSRICLGAMTFGAGEPSASNPLGGPNHAMSDTIVGQALDAGINFIDTADVYGSGLSETVLGEVLGERRRQVFLATKLNARMGPGVNQVGQSRLHVMDALEDSLRRLKTDHIDLYQVHNFDHLTAMEQTLRALDDAIRMGKVRYIGCSNYAAWQLMKALGLSDRHGLERFISVQSFYSLAGRDIERELIPSLADEGVGLLCWSPLAGGLLSGKIDRYGSSDMNARRSRSAFPPVDEARALDTIDVLRSIADRRGVRVPEVALAWLLAQPAVTSVISGISKPEHLIANIKAIELTLDADDLADLDSVSQLPASYPGWIQTYRSKGRVPEGHPWHKPSWGPGEIPVE